MFPSKPRRRLMRRDSSRLLKLYSIFRKQIQTKEYEAICALSNPQDIDFLTKFSKTHTSNIFEIALGRSASTDASSTKEHQKISLPSEIDMTKFWQVMSVPANRKYFVDNLVRYREPVKDSFEIRLPAKAYDNLQGILSRLVEIMIRDKDYESIIAFLPLVTKFSARVSYHFD
jgi:hypothetical protein